MNRSVPELAALAAMLACLAVAAQAQQLPLQPAQDPAISYSAAGLTIHADQMELDALLSAIGDRLGIAIVMPPMEPRHISLTTKDEPVAEVLRRALRGRSYVLSFDQPWTGPIEGSPNRLWILPRNNEAAGQPLNWSEQHFSGDPATGLNENSSIPDAIAFADGSEARLVASLSSIALSADEASLRERAVFALGDLADSRGLSGIEKALKDSSPVVRQAAVLSLSGFRSPSVIDSLEQALADEDAAVRESAVLALAESGEPGAASVLRKALSDPDPAVRQAAEDLLDEAFWQD